MANLTGIVAVMLILLNCLQANPLKWPVHELKTLKEKLDNISFTELMLLYTPVNVKENCFKKALECFRAELDIVMYKGQDELGQGMGFDTLIHFQKFLASLMSEMKEESESPDQCSCETNPQQYFPAFKQELKKLIEQVIDHSTTA